MHTSVLRTWLRAVLILAGGSIFQTASAAVVHVSPQDNLAEIFARARAGDTLKLASGVYQTKLYIDKPITIEGLCRPFRNRGRGQERAYHSRTRAGRNAPQPDRYPFRYEPACNGCRYLSRRNRPARPD